MGILFNFFVLSIGSIFGSVYLNKRYEEMMPINVMIIIFILFIFYMLNIPLIGFYLIHFINYILLILSARKFYRNKDKRKDYLKNLFTPGMLIFGAVALLIYLATKGNYAMLFDELRMWGAYPKSIFITNKLMIGKDLFFSTDYYPGMPLFQYFFARNYGSFIEAHLFLSYGIAILSLLIPVTKKITWEKLWIIVPAIIFLYSFPVLFANSGFDALFYYSTLFIDPALGMFFGYSLFLSTKKMKNNRFTYFLFCLSLTLIILMKITGLVLSGIVLISFFIHQWLVHHDFKFKLLKTYIRIIIPILITLITFFSWQITVNNKSDNVVSNVNTNQLKNAVQLVFNPTSEQSNFIKKYVNHINDTSLIINNNNYSDKITIPNLLILFLLIMFIVFISIKKSKKKPVLTASFVGVLSVFIYLLFYLFIYIFVFNNTITCYGRYISTVFSGLSFFTIYILNDYSDDIKNKNLYLLLISVMLTVYFFNYPDINNHLYYHEYKRYYQSYENTTNVLSNKVLEKTGKTVNNKSMMTIYNSCDSLNFTCVLYQHQLYLSLIDNGIYVEPNGIYVVGSTGTDYPIVVNNHSLDYFVTQFDYILIVEDLVDINKTDSKILQNNTTSGTLFKVIKQDNKYKIEKME